MTIILRPAETSDLPAVAALMNDAFRGTPSERNWCVETGYIAGERTNVSLLAEELVEGAWFLLAEQEGRTTLQGCVSLHALSPERWYLGSLTVCSTLQNAGFGRRLLSAAEEYAAMHGARTIEMTVVSVRDTLIAWYERRGYSLTGENRPFPYGDTRFGTPTREDLRFVVLEKLLPGY